VDHDGGGNRGRSSENGGGIDKGAVRGNYRGVVDRRKIAEAGVGMVESITQIDAA